jgi:hypothetical protein
MTVLPFIPKEIPGLPDFYRMIVFYIDGKNDKFELVGHSI